MKTKSQAPIEYLQNQSTPPLIETYYEFNQLKRLYRQGWLKRGIAPEQCESVADHTLGVAILSLWIADQVYPHLDRMKILRMALLHDFGEIYAGDITPDDVEGSARKALLERRAIRKVFTRLPHGEEYIACWEEFEKGESPEARFVRQVDRLEMALQTSIYRREGLATPEEFMETARKAITADELKQILGEIDDLEPAK